LVVQEPEAQALESTATDVPSTTPEATATSQPTPEPSPTPETAPVDSAEPAGSAAAAPAEENALVGAAWEWLDSDTPGCDLLVFQPDGSLSFQADCQVGTGNYILTGNALELKLPAEPVGDLGVRLAGVNAFSLNEGVLVLSKTDGSVLRFSARTLLTQQPSQDGGQAKLLYNTPVYLGPGAVYPLVGVLPAGSAAPVTLRIFQYDWWGISMPNLPDGIGWIRAGAAEMSNVEAIPYTAIERLQVGGDALLWPGLNSPRASISGEVRLYAGPAESYALVMAGLPGDTFYVLGRSEDNAFLLLYAPQSVVPSGLAWVRADQVETRNIDNVPAYKAPPAPGISRFTQPAAGQGFAAPMTYVNIRGGPGVEYTVYGHSERGEIYLITGVTPDGVWYRIRVPQSISEDGIAWISAPNVRAFETQNVPVVQYAFPMPYLRADTLGPACQVVSQNPREFSIFKLGETFNIEFEIRNHTADTWSRGDIDYVYIDNIDNAPMHTGASRLDLEQNVAAGETTWVKFEVKAPTKHPGVFGERWVMRKAGETVCAFTFQMRVRE
jgi:uncharacterized protein YraI